jgi:bacterioferritin-associated ferredoxin
MMQLDIRMQGRAMYVCVCNAITDREIREAVRNGARNLRQLRATLPLGVGCGRCIESAREIVAGEQVRRTCPAARQRTAAARLPGNLSIHRRLLPAAAMLRLHGHLAGISTERTHERRCSHPAAPEQGAQE